MKQKALVKRAKVVHERRGAWKRKRLSLTERDIFLVVSTKYATNGLPLPQREVLRKLRHLLPYRDYSERQLRRIVEKALNDPRSDQFWRVRLIPPVDWEMGKAIQDVMQGLHEVIVIPSVSLVDPAMNEFYLGLATAEIFGRRFVGGQAIGLGSGRAIQAFASSLELTPEVANNLKFFALAYRETSEGETGAEPLMEVIVRCAGLSAEPSVEGYIAPTELKPEDLNWVFFCIEPTKAKSQNEAIAQILGFPLTRDGLPPLHSFPQSADTNLLPLLQRMVQQGRGVVAIAGGKESAEAVIAAYRTKRAGGLIFNILVVDDSCAEEILRLSGLRSSDVPNRHEWWLKKNRFLTAHLRYASDPPMRTFREIANRLFLSIKQVKRFLEEAIREREGEKPILTLKVQPPSLEMALEAELLQRFNLLEARVVPSLDGEDKFKVLGQTAVNLLLSLLRSQREFSLGLGGGRAVHAMVECLNLKQLLKEVPELKRLSICALALNPLPRVLSVAPQTLVAPIITRCDAHDIVKVCYYDAQKSDNLDAVFVGIGSMEPPDSLSYFLDDELMSICDKLAGLILFQFITHDGEIVPTSWMERLRAMPLGELRKMVAQGKPVVIVACGTHKATAILAAHKAKLFNCLVVDCNLASRLLSLSSKNEAVSMA